MNTNYFFKQNAKKVIFLIIIIPIIIQLILINFVQSVHNEVYYYLLFFVFGLLYLPYFHWLNIAVEQLYKNSIKYTTLKISSFKVSLVINIIVIFNFVYFVAYVFSFLIKNGQPNTEIVSYFIMIQFIGVISFAYNGFFVSKLLRSFELKREASFSDVASNFVTLSIPPLAVWIIHNKVKIIFENNN